MNSRQRRKKASQKAQQAEGSQVPGTLLQVVTPDGREQAIPAGSDNLVKPEMLVILLVALLGFGPIGLVLATNKLAYYEYVVNPDKRSGVFSYASFWLSAAAALAAGRGVLRNDKAEARLFKDSDYYWEGATFLFAAAVCAALAVSDYPSTHKLFLSLLICLFVAQIVISAIALNRLRGQPLKWRRALLLRTLSLLILLLGLTGYGYLVFEYAP